MVLKTAKGAANLEEITPVVLTPAESDEQRHSTDNLMQERDRAAILRAEAKRIHAELKELNAGKRAAKAERVAMTPLQKVVAKQATTPVWLPGNLADRVTARVEAGQDQETAIKEVFVALEVATRTVLDKPAAE
jgi:hypothetical protein